MSREVTNRVYDLVEEGLISCETFVVATLKYLSEDEVKEMAQMNEWPIGKEEEE